MLITGKSLIMVELVVGWRCVFSELAIRIVPNNLETISESPHTSVLKSLNNLRWTFEYDKGILVLAVLDLNGWCDDLETNKQHKHMLVMISKQIIQPCL